MGVIYSLPFFFVTFYERSSENKTTAFYGLKKSSGRNYKKIPISEFVVI